MASAVGFRFTVDREAVLFNLEFDYFIDGYSDPETGEYFGETFWSFSYLGGGTSGYAAEFGSGTVELGFAGGETALSYALDFSAFNIFSAEAIEAHWRIIDAGLATGDQTLVGTGGEDVILGGSGDDLLRGQGGQDLLDGGDGDDLLEGGADADRLEGGAGEDILIGGAGDDVMVVDAAGDIVVEKANGGIDTVQSSVDVTLAAEVERLELLGLADLKGSGNAGDNDLVGNAGANHLHGLGGNDTLYGGAGNDRLYGEAGNDRLEGGGGIDFYDGGDGNDVYVIDNKGEKIVELPGGGIDTVQLGTGIDSYTLGTELENLRSGGGPLRGIGNALDNEISGAGGGDVLAGQAGDDLLRGEGGSDRLEGGAGNDRLEGGAGADTAFYGASLAGVAVNLGTGAASGGDAAGDQFLGIENLTGSGFDDQLTGNGGANALTGGAGDDTLLGEGGNDTLRGGTGADRLEGGAGLDTASYVGSLVGVSIDLAAGTASGGDAQGDMLAGIENLIGGDGADQLSGDGGANALTGGSGDDTLLGGGGNDTLRGGAGADTLDGGTGLNTLSYAGSAEGVIVNLALGTAAGGDAEGDSFSHVVNLTGGNGGDLLTGDGGANRLDGGQGTDSIDGGAGNDWIRGGAGPDHLVGGDGLDTLSYAGSASGVSIDLLNQTAANGDAGGDSIEGFEHVEGSEAGDVILGDAGNNRLSGRAGFDYIIGGGGKDILSGGADLDSFAFATGFGRDTITDFTTGELIDFVLGEDFDSFAEVMAVASDTASGALLDFGADRLLLQGVAVASLTAADFVFS
jgi:Ca2+-binding RTX toxin-like protein